MQCSLAQPSAFISSEKQRIEIGEQTLMHFENKTIPIAGASSGIGRSVALQLEKIKPNCSVGAPGG